MKKPVWLQKNYQSSKLCCDEFCEDFNQFHLISLSLSLIRGSGFFGRLTPEPELMNQVHTYNSLN